MAPPSDKENLLRLSDLEFGAEPETHEEVRRRAAIIRKMNDENMMWNGQDYRSEHRSYRKDKPFAERYDQDEDDDIDPEMPFTFYGKF